MAGLSRQTTVGSLRVECPCGAPRVAGTHGSARAALDCASGLSAEAARSFVSRGSRREGLAVVKCDASEGSRAAAQPRNRRFDGKAWRFPLCPPSCPGTIWVWAFHTASKSNVAPRRQTRLLCACVGRHEVRACRIRPSLQPLTPPLHAWADFCAAWGVHAGTWLWALSSVPVWEQAAATCTSRPATACVTRRLRPHASPHRSTLVLPSHSCRSTRLQTGPEGMHLQPSSSHSLFSTLPLQELQRCDSARICL